MQNNILERIPAPLLFWYAQNKRTLAWRSEPTPYHVWVSEIMLQQTRVEAVKGYYERFIEALPTVQALALCEEETLLKLWEGLGYYSRVRNMQKAARQIVNEFDGEFPQTKEELLSLAGIGEYTAGAILSIAFGKRIAAVDGNVLRVISRLTQNPTPINDTAYKKRLTEDLSAVYPQEGVLCSQFTQSLFELGALVCKPKTPLCSACPLNGFCEANRQGTQQLYPVMPQKRAKREENVFVFLLQTPEGFCIRRREEGVLKGMNEFPSFVRLNGESVDEALFEWGIYDYEIIREQKFTHIFTHIKWNITCVWVRTESAPFDSFSLEEIEERISLPTAFKQCLKILEK